MEKRIVTERGREVEVKLFPCVAICLGAWGAGDTPEAAKKNMIRAGGKPDRYIAFKAPTDKLTCEGSSLVAYPPLNGSFQHGEGFSDVEETRYAKGRRFATGAYGNVEWPDARKAVVL